MPSIDQINKAAMEFDWQQVVLNGGPPCFHVCDDGNFCGRAKGWDGHNCIHGFISLADLVAYMAERAGAEALINVLDSAISDSI